MKSTIQTLLRSTILIGLVLAIAWFVPGRADAQGGDVKPIRLVTGDVIPAIVTPDEMVVSPDAVFDGKYFKIIQFISLPNDADRKRWEANGLFLGDYLHDDAYFAVINQSFDLQVLADKVTTLIDVADPFRLEPPLAEIQAQGQATGRLVVSYYATLDPAKVLSDLEARGVRVEAHRDYSRQLDIVFDSSRQAEIIALPYLQFLGLEPEQPVLEGYDHRNTSGRSNYLNTGFAGLNYNGAGVVIAIGEDGTVDNLVDAKGRLTEMESGAASDHKIGVMQNAGGAGNLDPSNRNNAWGVTVLSVAGTPDYAGLYSSASVRYTNHSYGVSIEGGYDSLARDHDLRIASYPNHLVIYSSGNSGTSTGYSPYSFAGWANITGKRKQNKNMFAIGALEPDDDLASFSSRGPMYDGRIIPQLVIEGIEGTSDAAPKVTGELAMLAQVYKAKNGGAESPSSLLRAIMMNTADDLDDAGPDYKTGYGRPNLRRAYVVLDNGRYLASSVANGNTNSHTITVPANTKQFRVMVVWPDVAAAVNADPAIVNDLDLVATDPSSTSYLPWVLDATANVTAIDNPATRGVDNLNTIEQVTVDDPAAGVWTIDVAGTSVPTGPQTYYLTYEFLMDELQIAFPLKDHRFVSGSSYHLKWDSYGGVGAFSLAYQIDGGTWVSIASGYSAASRTYQWTAPSVSGIHTIKFRVQRGALTSESDVNYIGAVPGNFYVHWVCNDAVRLVWNPVSGATSYVIYRLGSQYMGEVTSGITFDGASAILTGQSTVSDEYYAVGAVTGGNEGPLTLSVQKSAGDYNCFYAKTTVASSVDEANIILKGLVNPHNSTLTNVHFEYGPTASYGSSSSNISISASGHEEEAVSKTIASTLTDRADVLHFRLVADKDGSAVYGEDQEIRLPSGYDFTFDGANDYIDVSDHSALPIYRNGAGTGYSVAFWVNGATGQAAKRLYFEGSSTSSTQRLAIQTRSSGVQGITIVLRDDAGTYLLNNGYTNTVFDSSWHHVAFVDGNGAGKLYIDGNLAGNLNYTPTTITLDRASIGAEWRTAASDFFTGRIDEVSIWDKALSAAEITALMHKALQGNEANLKAYFRLDDGASGRVFDPITGSEATIGGGGSKTFSTAPVGTAGKLVQTTSTTSVGDTGKELKVTITSASPTTNYLGIYRLGNSNSYVTDTAKRASIFWGLREFGNVTATLVFDYSNVPNISNPSQLRLLKRSDAASSWTDVTSDFVHDTTTRTFTKTGVTDFSEFSIGHLPATAITLTGLQARSAGDAPILPLVMMVGGILAAVGFRLRRRSR